MTTVWWLGSVVKNCYTITYTQHSTKEVSDWQPAL